MSAEAGDPRANIAVVSQVYETAARGAADEMLALMDDDIRIVLPEALPYGGTYRGKQGVRDLGTKLYAPGPSSATRCCAIRPAMTVSLR
jgi:ketosteroid isomerase-like protein